MYTKLLSCRREIRLLSLSPDLKSAKLCFYLSTVSLDDLPSYHALSYTWGDLRDKVTISINGFNFPVTNNLHAALRCLQQTSLASPIWIDAVCINQDCPSEKSQQIRLMYSIYANAQKTIVWLGEASVDSGIAMDTISKLGEDKSSGFVWDTEEHNDRSPSTAFIREARVGADGIPYYLNNEEGSLIDTSFIESFVALFNRDWWTRTWVVQEIALAKDAQIFCGDLSVSWDYMERAFMRTVLNGPRKSPSFVPLLRRLQADQITGLMKGSPDRGHDSAKGPLLDLLHTHAGRGVYNPQDKIYAMLSLSTDPEHTLPKPDYKQPFEQVYRQTTLNFIKHSRNLDVLSHVWDPEENSVHPSWVPNWDKAYRPTLLLHSTGTRTTFQSAGKSRVKMNDSEDPQALRLNGLLIDNIDSVSSPADVEDWNRSYKRWETFTKMDDKPWRPYVGGGDFFNAFWRTLVTNKAMGPGALEGGDPTPQQAPEDDRRIFEHFSGRDIAPQQLLKDRQSVQKPTQAEVQNFWARLINSIKCRRLFTTTKGHFGTGPDYMKTGDQVCVLLGGATRFIVRPNKDVYRLIGECYVHGLMYGEALKGIKTGEARIVEFRLS